MGAWKFEWLPTTCPSIAIRRAASGYALAHRPCMKKVDAAPAFDNMSMIMPTESAPPPGRLGCSASKVSATWNSATTSPAGGFRKLS